MIKRLATVVAIAALLLVSCGDDDDTTADSGTATTAADGGTATTAGEAEADGEPLKIGVISGLTGAYVELGESQANGANLAAKLLGGKAGNRPIEIIVRDDQLKPEAALREAQSLVQEEDVDFLTGCVSAATTLAVNQVAKEAGVPYLGTCQTEQLNRPPNFDPDYTYHVAPTPSMYIKAATPWICETLGTKVFLMLPDYAYGHEQNSAYINATEAAEGCDIVGTAWAPLGTTDFNPYIPQIDSSGADVLVLGVAGRDQVSFMRQAEQFGLKDRVKIFFFSDLTFDEELGFDLLEGTYGMSGFYWTIDNPKTQEYVEAYEQEYGKPPGGYSVYLFDVVNVIAEQVAAGAESPEDFRAALEGYEWDGALTGTMRACDHQLLQPVYMLRGLGSAEAESVGGSATHGFREIVETVPAGEETAPTCDEVKEEFVPAQP